MCFAPQARALFECLNWQKCSEPEVFCTFWIQNVLCATAASTFSTAQLPKAVWPGVFCNFLTSKCASDGSACTRRFSEPTFRLPEPQSIGRTRCFASSYLFAALTCCLLPFTLTRPTSAFPSVHIVGSLTSNLTFKKRKHRNSQVFHSSPIFTTRIFHSAQGEASRLAEDSHDLFSEAAWRRVNPTRVGSFRVTI